MENSCGRQLAKHKNTAIYSKRFQENANRSSQTQEFDSLLTNCSNSEDLLQCHTSQHLY